MAKDFNRDDDPVTMAIEAARDCLTVSFAVHDFAFDLYKD
jgi:hypothetical protein